MKNLFIILPHLFYIKRVLQNLGYRSQLKFKTEFNNKDTLIAFIGSNKTEESKNFLIIDLLRNSFPFTRNSDKMKAYDAI